MLGKCFGMLEMLKMGWRSKLGDKTTKKQPLMAAEYGHCRVGIDSHGVGIDSLMRELMPLLFRCWESIPSMWESIPSLKTENAA